ncbi:hypothetical protein BN946_scf185011.g27 [Trametes cinnabarina]|uniref:Uncharacterized protein n=1 Tax=Pycnoporus cinnabarinus TaxID=5643 RepID=A0A060SV88_PYCCI|nr:hypothetical protein BN946_scf185011.g27 [Trametes cinnabarina]
MAFPGPHIISLNRSGLYYVPYTFYDTVEPVGDTIVQEDSLSAMLQEFIDAEQTAISYGGVLRDFLLNEAERHIPSTPPEEIERRNEERRELTESTNLLVLGMREDAMDYESDADSDGCPGLTTDDDSSDTESDTDGMLGVFLLDDDEPGLVPGEVWLMERPDEYEELAGRDLVEDFLTLALAG